MHRSVTVRFSAGVVGWFFKAASGHLDISIGWFFRAASGHLNMECGNGHVAITCGEVTAMEPAASGHVSFECGTCGGYIVAGNGHLDIRCGSGFVNHVLAA